MFKVLKVLLLVAGALPLTAWPVTALADDAADLIAGRSKSCVKCVLVNAPLKRKDLAGADLSGADLSSCTGPNSAAPSWMARI
jgi:hypothetical protein